MYNEYFGLNEQPFSIAPDPRYLYMSEQHREALAHLVYGFNSDGGFVLLTGEVGTGKTTVCRCLLEQIPESSSIAFVLNPKLSVNELLATICDEFHIEYPQDNTSLKLFTDLINAFLFKAHEDNKRVVLIIDEAQNLSPDVLEQLRLLTNLETNQKKLLQIILLGQDELRDMLSQPELRQLSQRIIARFHLGPLSKNDVRAYVTHRLSIAGLKQEVFPPSTIDRLYSLSGGIPRIINLLCDRSLLGTYIMGKKKVTGKVLNKAANEVLESPDQQGRRLSPFMAVAALILIVFAVVFAAANYNRSPEVATLHEDAPPLEAAVPDAVTITDKLIPSEGVSTEESRNIALTALFRLWDISYNADENTSACWQSQLQGLSCRRRLGSLKNLQTMNRPAMLKLQNGSGHEYYAVLSSLNNDTASLTVGNERLNVAVSDVASQWLGDYIMLWRAPPEHNGEIQPGDEGPAVRWLDRQLAAINNREPAGGDHLLFDSALINEVKRFQMTEGLVPDGIVGTQTIIHINTVTSDNIPTLEAGRER